MNQATTTSRLSHANRRDENISVLHFKRFLEVFSAPVAQDSSQVMQRNAEFRVLHVARYGGNCNSSSNRATKYVTIFSPGCCTARELGRV